MSDIFNSYAEIMSDKGLVKTAKKDNKENTKPQGIDLEAVEMLYGVTPNGDEDHTTMVEKAHPKPVVIAPAYDRLNGLVENVMERQNVMVEIALKPTDGKLTNRRYVKAHDDLLNELLKTAFLLDNKGQEDLMKLADACAGKMVKRAYSWKDVLGTLGLSGLSGLAGYSAVAFLSLSNPAGWGIALGGLAIAAIINNFGPMMDRGVSSGCEKVIGELTDVIEDTDEAPSLTAQISDCMIEVNKVKELNDELTAMSVPDTESKLADSKKLLANYLAHTKLLMKHIPVWIALLKGAPQKDESFGGDAGRIVSKVWGLIWTSDTIDAERSLEALQSALTESRVALGTYFSNVKKFVDSKKEDIQKSLEEEKKRTIKDSKIDPQSAANKALDDFTKQLKLNK